MKKLFLPFLVFCCLIGGFGALVPAPAQADGCAAADSYKQYLSPEALNNLPALPRYCTTAEVSRKIINIALGLIGAVAILFIIIGGYRYMTAGGNSEQATEGRQTAVYAVLGLVVVLLAVTIVNVVVNAVIKGKVF